MFPSKNQACRGCVRKGFTLVELVIGLCILAMVATALSGLAFGVCDGWNVNRDAENAYLASRQAARQVQHLLRPARQVGLAAPDGRKIKNDHTEIAAAQLGAMCMFWATDDTNAGTAELSELALLEHDLLSGDLKLYRLPSTSAKALTPCRGKDFDDSDDAIGFKTMAGIHVQTIATNISEMRFRSYTAPGATAPSLIEFTVKMQRDGREFTQYATAALRAPAVPALAP